MKAELALSPDQVSRLTAWHEQVADEPHHFKHDPTKKPHDVTHVPMIGRQEAFDSTVPILTPAQRNQIASLFGTIPPGLSGHKPHEIIEQVLNKKADLALSEDQVARLTAWHEQVADEPHWMGGQRKKIEAVMAESVGEGWLSPLKRSPGIAGRFVRAAGALKRIRIGKRS